MDYLGHLRIQRHQVLFLSYCIILVLAEDAYEQLVTLSPYELKELLHHILSGREFGVSISKSFGQLFKFRQRKISEKERKEKQSRCDSQPLLSIGKLYDDCNCL